jgi:tryptophanyl-tRNA synthetase
VTGQSLEQVLGSVAGQGFGSFKPMLADAIIALLAPLRSRLELLRNDPAELDRLLDQGSGRAAAIGAPTLAAALEAVGLGRRP